MFETYDSFEGLYNAVLADLVAELAGEPGYDENALRAKLTVAMRQVLQARTKAHHGEYPPGYSEKRAARDLSQFYSQIHDVCLFDWNTIGIEFQTSSTENSTTRTYRDRDRLFNGITPLTRC